MKKTPILINSLVGLHDIFVHLFSQVSVIYKNEPKDFVQNNFSSVK